MMNPTYIKQMFVICWFWNLIIPPLPLCGMQFDNTHEAIVINRQIIIASVIGVVTSIITATMCCFKSQRALRQSKKYNDQLAGKNTLLKVALRTQLHANEALHLQHIEELQVRLPSLPETRKQLRYGSRQY